MRDQTTKVINGGKKVKEATEFENVVDCKFKVALFKGSAFVFPINLTFQSSRTYIDSSIFTF